MYFLLVLVFFLKFFFTIISIRVFRSYCVVAHCYCDDDGFLFIVVVCAGSYSSSSHSSIVVRCGPRRCKCHFPSRKGRTTLNPKEQGVLSSDKPWARAVSVRDNSFQT